MHGPKPFTETLFSELGTMPPQGMALILVFNLVSGLHALSLWRAGRDSSVVDGLVFAIEMLFGAVAIFLSTMLLVDRRASFAAFARFLAALVATFLPLLLTAGLLLVTVKADYREGWVLVLVALMLAVFPLTSLLAAWPLAQALSHVFVSPVRVLSATRGHRWALVGTNYAVGALNRISPDIDAARERWEALLIVAVQIGVGFGSMMLMVSIIASAWRSNRSLGPTDREGQAMSSDRTS